MRRRTSSSLEISDQVEASTDSSPPVSPTSEGMLAIIAELPSTGADDCSVANLRRVKAIAAVRHIVTPSAPARQRPLRSCVDRGEVNVRRASARTGPRRSGARHRRHRLAGGGMRGELVYASSDLPPPPPAPVVLRNPSHAPANGNRSGRRRVYSPRRRGGGDAIGIRLESCSPLETAEIHT